VAILNAPRIDLGGSGKKSFPVADLNDILVSYLTVGSAGDYFKQITIRTNRRWWNMAQFQASHAVLVDRVMYTIDLDLEAMLRMMVLWVMMFWVMFQLFFLAFLILLIFVHGNLLN
jgi:hypothetical protein